MIKQINRLLLLQAQGIIDNTALEKYTHLIPLSLQWFDPTCKNRKKITINKSNVSGTKNLLNIPVLINITDSDLTSAKADGSDICICDKQHKKLDYEIQEFDQGTGKLVVWIKLATLFVNKDTIFYIYWEDATAIDRQNKNAVWVGYDAVYHLNNTSFGVDSIKDSTSNNRHGDTAGTVTSVTGDAGKALDLDKTGSIDSYVDLKTAIADLGANDFTIIWAGTIHLYESLGATLFSQGNNIFTVNQSSKLFFQKQGGGFETITSSISVILNTFNVVAITKKGLTSGDTKLFINGVQSDNATAIPDIAIGGNVKRICAENALQATRRFDGVADECRIIVGIALTVDEIKTITENLKNPSTFMTFGTKESL